MVVVLYAPNDLRLLVYSVPGHGCVFSTICYCMCAMQSGVCYCCAVYVPMAWYWYHSVYTLTWYCNSTLWPVRDECVSAVPRYLRCRGTWWRARAWRWGWQSWKPRRRMAGSSWWSAPPSPWVGWAGTPSASSSTVSALLTCKTTTFYHLAIFQGPVGPVE